MTLKVGLSFQNHLIYYYSVILPFWLLVTVWDSTSISSNSQSYKNSVGLYHVSNFKGKLILKTGWNYWLSRT